MRPTRLEEFASWAAAACIDAPALAETIFFVDDDDEEGLACLGVERDEKPQIGALDQFFAGEHRYAALATMVSWAPDGETDFAPSWLIVAVTHDRPAMFSVIRIEEQKWYEVPAKDAPWFAASTAGSLRKALQGVPLGPFKRARDGDKRLFGAMSEGDPPPPDDKGRI
jgi:hypothetical protein